MRFWFKLDAEVAAIIDSLRSQPERWDSDEFYLFLNEVKSNSVMHGASRQWYSPLRIWIANGPPYLNLDRRKERWDAYSRQQLWKAYKHWKKRSRTSRLESPVIAALGNAPRPEYDESEKVIQFPKGPAA